MRASRVSVARLRCLSLRRRCRCASASLTFCTSNSLASLNSCIWMSRSTASLFLSSSKSRSRCSAYCLSLTRRCSLITSFSQMLFPSFSAMPFSCTDFFVIFASSTSLARCTSASSAAFACSSSTLLLLFSLSFLASTSPFLLCLTLSMYASLCCCNTAASGRRFSSVFKNSTVSAALVGPVACLSEAWKFSSSSPSADAPAPILFRFFSNSSMPASTSTAAPCLCTALFLSLFFCCASSIANSAFSLSLLSMRLRMCWRLPSFSHSSKKCLFSLVFSRWICLSSCLRFRSNSISRLRSSSASASCLSASSSKGWRWRDMRRSFGFCDNVLSCASKWPFSILAKVLPFAFSDSSRGASLVLLANPFFPPVYSCG
mmetsp:Transcript_26605/g.68296  ORF Transcript_26605/g.68296 Transcript_26605/m.68296 type:complete len:374 (+) Transcript_26605:446-1567(+)